MKIRPNIHTALLELEEDYPFVRLAQPFATGVSLILHPKNPFVPTVHANYRFIVHGQSAWVGGSYGSSFW